MRSSSWTASLLTVLALSLGAGSGGRARAEPEGGPAAAPPPTPRYRLDYRRREGAEACPDTEALEAGVSARLGYEPFEERAALVVRATVQRTDRALEARVEMLDDGGTRTAERQLTSRQSDCEELAAAMELAISIAIDPFHGAPPASRPSVPSASIPVRAGLSDAGDVTPPPPAPAAPRSTRESAPVAAADPTLAVKIPGPAPAPQQPLRPALEIGMLAGTGTAPGRSVGAAVQAGVRRGDLSLSLEGRADLPGTAPAESGEIRASVLVASLVPCWHLRALGFCALATAGALRAAGQGLMDQRQVTIPFFALAARVRAERPFARLWSLAVHADISAPLVETELRVGGQTRWTSPPLTLAAGLRVGIRIP